MALHRLKGLIIKQILSHNLSKFKPSLPFMHLETGAVCRKCCFTLCDKANFHQVQCLLLPWNNMLFIATKSLAWSVCWKWVYFVEFHGIFIIILKGVEIKEFLAEDLCFKMLFQGPKLSFLDLHHLFLHPVVLISSQC